MKITQVLNGHVLIRPRVAKQIAGIEIPDSVDKERATTGEVVIGNTVGISGTFANAQMSSLLYQIGAGDIVIFNSLSPRKIVHENEDCLLIPSEDIYAVIQE
jgi:co-chaperonin GroES (HSP10)